MLYISHNTLINIYLHHLHDALHKSSLAQEGIGHSKSLSLKLQTSGPLTENPGPFSGKLLFISLDSTPKLVNPFIFDKSGILSNLFPPKCKILNLIQFARLSDTV